MRFQFILALLIVFIFMPLAAWADSGGSKKQVFGVNEKVLLPEISKKVIDAKLDTGASTTSLGAYNIKVFTQNGREMVSFIPQFPGAEKMQLPLVRYSTIKIRNEEGIEQRSIKRPVVSLVICMDGRSLPIEVNLTDRSHFKFPLLIGTSALKKFNAIVDPSLKNTSMPECR